MAMPVIPESRRYSVAEVLDFPPDGNRYEVVAGELLVTPAPTAGHQLLVSRLMTLLSDYLKPLGRRDSLYSSPADITWGQSPKDAEDLVQPDIFVVVATQVTSWRDVTRLALAIEVLSPWNTRAERVVKRGTYQRHGVETYWVVDGAAQLVEVWRPADDRPEIMIQELVWKLSDESPELRIPLADLFAPPGSR